MWFRFWKPDYFYFGRSYLIDASDGSPWNRGWSQGFGFFVLDCRWNEGRSEQRDGIHYPAFKRTIVVNGELREWKSAYISYDDVIGLASERPGASVIYRNAVAWGDCGDSGILCSGEYAMVKDGTKFTAVMTGNA